jgi:molybdopterin synthase catalytic subunit
MRHATGVAWACVSPDPLPVQEVVESVADRRAGAVASFQGVVRDHDRGAPVLALEYQAHPSAGAALGALLAELALRQGVLAVAAAHRTGRLLVGEVAMVAAVSAEHRAQAFEVCRELVDRLKAEVPLWKRQEWADGGVEWVGTT